MNITFKQVTIRRFALPLILLAASSVMVWAGCKSDCRDEYESEVDSCKLLYDDPDDAFDLQLCIQNAKDEYQSCIEECDN
jgi:hypothetical protein